MRVHNKERECYFKQSSFFKLLVFLKNLPVNKELFLFFVKKKSENKVKSKTVVNPHVIIISKCTFFL